MLETIKHFMQICPSQEQLDYYNEILKRAKLVKIEKAQDILQDEYLSVIEDIDPQVKECFSNAGKMALYASNIIYCEGYYNVCGIDMEHAFNKYVDPITLQEHYFDITAEYALQDVKIDEYIVIAEYTKEQLFNKVEETNYWGGVFSWEYYMTHKK